MVNEWLIVIAFLCEKHHFYGQVLVLAQSKNFFQHRVHRVPQSSTESILELTAKFCQI